MGADNPLVACICLTANRVALTHRALACFEAQTYPNKLLLILDSGTQRYQLPRGPHPLASIVYVNPDEYSLGILRNIANGTVSQADVIAHWDSDDWRDPASLSELVHVLTTDERKPECVGYNDCLFYDSSRARAFWWKSNMHPTMAEPLLGGSMVYWRKAWERRAFEDVVSNEDAIWMREVVRVSVTSAPDARPRMIVERHGGNTSAIDLDYQCEHASQAWKRADSWDAYCARMLGGS